MQHQCQEKNDTQVEKVATFFSSCIEDCERGSQLMMRFEKCEHQSREQIVPYMRENAGSQTAAQENEKAEERAEDRKHNHVARTLVSMRSAEQERREDNPRGYRTPRPCGELALQIAAKNRFFRDPGDHAETNPRRHFASVGGRQLRERVEGLLLRGIGS